MHQVRVFYYTTVSRYTVKKQRKEHITGLVKIMLTIMDSGIIYSTRNVCPGFKWYVSRWLLRVKHDGEHVETVLQIILHISCMFCE